MSMIGRGSDGDDFLQVALSNLHTAEQAKEKLRGLIHEVRRIMTQLSDSAILEQLQEAIDEAES